MRSRAISFPTVMNGLKTQANIEDVTLENSRKPHLIRGSDVNAKAKSRAYLGAGALRHLSEIQALFGRKGKVRNELTLRLP